MNTESTTTDASTRREQLQKMGESLKAKRIAEETVASTRAEPLPNIEPTFSPQPPDPYQERLKEIIADCAAMQATGITIDLFEPNGLLSAIDLSEDNSKLRDWFAKSGGVKPADFAKAMRLQAVRDELGSVPKSAADLVALYVKKHDVAMTYDETITRRSRPHIVGDEGKPIYIDAASYGADDYEKIYTDCVFSPTIDGLEFRRDIRMVRDRHALPYDVRSIDDAVDAWQADAKAHAKSDMIAEIIGCIPARRLTADAWTEIAERIFDCTETGADFVVDVLQHFIWQVKRKLRNIPVERHLMPVIIGKQGGGKSTFVNALLSPIASLTVSTTFKMATDEKIIDLWRSYVLFFDEMQHAGSADVEAVKGLITAQKVTRRPMRTNGTMSFENHATFIGCSNKTLAQLIRDETGMRRFAELRFRDDADWEFINSVEWQRLWQSVDHRGAAPILRSMAVLSGQQEAARQKSRVETWLEAVIEDSEDYRDDRGDGFRTGSKVTAPMLFQRYSDYEEKFFPGGAFRMSLTAFGNELRRIRDMNTVKGAVVSKGKNARGYYYQILDPSGMPLGMSANTARVVPISARGNWPK